jgi:peptidoglycan hydrolase CwlO-like protein
MEDYKEFIPWILAFISTSLALKKDWIVSKFTKQEKELEVSASKESVESSALQNVEKTMSIYRSMVEDLKHNIDDLKNEIGELKQEVVDLKAFIKEQKVFISKQTKSLEYYEKKYGKITG